VKFSVTALAGADIGCRCAVRVAVVLLGVLAGAASAQTAALTEVWGTVRHKAGVADEAIRDRASKWVDNAGRALNEVGLGTPQGEPRPSVLAPADRDLDTTAPLGLLQAWRAAIVNDPNLRAARAAEAVGRERLPQAQAQLKPSLQLNVNRFKNEVERDSVDFLGQPQTTNERYYSHSQTLSLRHPLFRQQQQAQLRQAGFLVADAQANLEREAQNLAVRLTSAYLEALLARDNASLIQAQGRLIATQLDAARKTLEKGTGTRTDVDEAQARLDLNRAQDLEARQQVELTRRQLQSIVNRSFGELAVLDPVRLKLTPPEPASLDEWVGRALRNSPEIRSLNAQKDAAREAIARARAGHLPTLDAVAQLQRSRSESVTSPQSAFTNASIGLQLNVPLYSGGSTSSEIRQANAEYERLRELLEAVTLDLGVRVHREYRGVTEGIARSRAMEVAVRSAEVALDSARKSFAAGVRTSLDVLNAEQQRAQLTRDLAQARYSTLLSRVRLQALVGGIDDATMQEVAAALGP